MEYAIQLNAVSNKEKNVKAFAAVTFGDSFKVTNIAVIAGKEGELFVAMPRFRTNARSEYNEAVYKDVCNPITKEFRAELYGEILDAFAEMEQSGRKEIIRSMENAVEPEFTVKVTPYEREGSNILGLGSIYLENCFVIGNVSILQGKEKEFVAMPSYRTNQKTKDGKMQYQDVCFPVTKEFREKLYGELLETYRQEKERGQQHGTAAKERAGERYMQADERELSFR